MHAIKNASGLYEFTICVYAGKIKREFKALVDTGSSDCIATYKIITFLRLRPIDSFMAQLVDRGPSLRLVYSANIGFSNKAVKATVVRANSLPAGYDFILGMSVLEYCKITKDAKGMTITWQ